MLQSKMATYKKATTSRKCARSVLMSLGEIRTKDPIEGCSHMYQETSLWKQ